MKKIFLTIFLISLGFSSLLSTLPALAALLVGKSFWFWFLLSNTVILFLGYLINLITDKRLKIKVEELALDREKALLEQSVEVGCSYCKKINDMVPVKLGQRNTFRCRHCNQENLITFFFGSAQITKPIEIPQLGTIQQKDI